MAEPANAEYVGQDDGSQPATAPQRSVDLAPVAFGPETFRNPIFWVFVGVVGTVTVQYMLNHSRKSNS